MGSWRLSGRVQLAAHSPFPEESNFPLGGGRWAVAAAAAFSLKERRPAPKDEPHPHSRGAKAAYVHYIRSEGRRCVRAPGITDIRLGHGRNKPICIICPAGINSPLKVATNEVIHWMNAAPERGRRVCSSVQEVAPLLLWVLVRAHTASGSYAKIEI